MKFRSIPTVIDAWQFTNDTAGQAIAELSNGKFSVLDKEDRNGGYPAAVFDDLHRTWINVDYHQWIIKGTKGEYYPCDDDVFKQKYEQVND